MKLAFVAAVLTAVPAIWGFAPSSSHHGRRANPGFVTVTSTSSSSSSSSLSAYVDIAESASRDVNTMDEWVTQCGVQRVEGVQLTSEDGLDWQLMTSQDVAASSSLLSIPNNLILSSSRSKEELEQVGNIADAADMLFRLGGGAEVPLFYLVAKVLLEYDRGDQSPWFPWLNSMPRLFYNAVSMTDVCIECLPPLVFSLSRKERVKVSNFYDAIQKVNFLSDQTKRNKGLVNWAFNVVSTRCWGPDEDKVIVPLADMFNHATDPEVAISYDEEGNCIAYTLKDVPAGSPLRMSYGDPTNPSQFFATYGFLDETSPATFCKIMYIQPNQELLDIGFDFSRMLFYKDTGDISEEVWDVLLYQTLMGNKEMQQAFYQAHMQGDVDTKRQIHQQYFLQTSTALKAHVDSFLESLDDLADRAKDKDPAQHPRLPLIQKHNEFVKTTFLRVKERLDPMVAQATGEEVLA